MINHLYLGYIDPGTGFVVASGLAGVLAAIASIGGVILIFFRRHWRKLLALLILIAAVVGLVMQLKSNTKPSGDPLAGRRIILLGLDGLAPELIESMMEQGELPNMAKLRDEGTYTHLDTSNPAQSPVAWATFATGRNPGKHGVYDFIRRNPKNYLPEVSLTRHDGHDVLPVRQGKAFWDYATDRGIETVIVQCPVTFPPDEISGRMLSGMGVPDLSGTQGTFAFFTSEPQSVTRDTGGRVFVIERADEMKLELPGPTRKASGGKMETVTAELTVTTAGDTATVKAGKQSVEFSVGSWSEWIELSFSIGPLKKMHGIVRFHLVELDPHFKLYVSPICIDPARPAYQISHPPHYVEELAEELGPFNTRGMPFDTWAVNEERLDDEAFLQQVDDLVGDKLKLLELELERFEKGILFFYFEDSDIIQHMYWRAIDSEHPLHAETGAQYGSVIRDMYLRMDRIVGQVLDRIGPDDVVFAFSDHGFGTFRRAAHINSWLVRNGYMVLRRGTSSGRELLGDVDWSRTRAYAIGFGGVYVNQAGREGQGIVSPGEETESLKLELKEGLSEWKDGDDGPRIANTVYTREEIFWGPKSGEAPDLYIGFTNGYRASWQTAVGAAPKALIEDNLKKWSGDHLIDPKLIPGVLFSNLELSGDDPGIIDLCPTLLELCGFDDEALAEMDLDGRSLLGTPAE